MINERLRKEELMNNKVKYKIDQTTEALMK